MKINKYTVVILILLITACASENEYLVNPPARYETVKVRFLNLARDGEQRTLVLEGKTEISNVPYGVVSDFVQPPADSVSVEILKQGSTELQLMHKVRFGRNMNYTFVALPSPDGSPNAKPVDTVVAVSTSVVVATSQKEAYLKLLNANPDTTVRYSIVLGCPSGINLTGMIDYRRVSAHSIVRSGEVAVSIVRHINSSSKLVGLYDLNLENFGQYTLIITKNGTSEDVLLLDEKKGSTSALSQPQKITQREAFLKVINFSNEAINIEKAGSGSLGTTLPMFADEIKPIEACGSTAKDTIIVSIGGITTAQGAISIDVMQKYTAFVFDSLQYKAKKLIIAEPIFLTEERKNRAIIRVINADYLQKGISVSAGARQIANASGEDLQRGFRSGDIFASSLEFGKISASKLIEPGTLPIAVFTATEPTKLISTARLWIEANKNYFLVVYSNEQGEQNLTLIEDKSEAYPISKLTEGVFTQVLNASSDNDFMQIEFPGLFSNAKLNFGGSLATILADGTSDISFAGKQFQIIATKNDRVMLISAGSSNNPELIKFIEQPVYAGNNYYIRRFVNASDISKINIKMSDSSLVYPELHFGERSPIEKIYKERKFSLLFENAETKKVIARIDDLFFTYNKTYTLIFAGNSKKGYSVIVQQEY